MEELCPDETCWTVIRGAASGDQRDQSTFSRRYLPVVRAYLAARWRDAALEQNLEDAIQDVFIECFRAEGVLERADRDQPGGFRAFLFGVVRNIALRTEHNHVEGQARKSPGSSHPEKLADLRIRLGSRASWCEGHDPLLPDSEVGAQEARLAWSTVPTSS